MHAAHVAEEVAGIEGDRCKAPDLLREVEVHREARRDAVLVEIVARVALHDEFGQLPVERRVVVAGPGEALGEGNLHVGLLPGGVIGRIDGHVAAPVVELFGGAEVVARRLEHEAARRTVAVLAQRLRIVEQRALEAHGEDHADARDVGDDRQVEVELFFEAAVADGGRADVVADIPVGAAVGHRGGGREGRGHLREVQPLVAVVVPVDAQLRPQGPDLCEVGREIKPDPLDGRPVGILGLRDKGVALLVAHHLIGLRARAVRDGHHAGLAVDRVDAVGGGDRAAGLQIGLRRQAVGERGIDRAAHVGVEGPVAVERHREARAEDRGLDADLALERILPLQIGVSERGRGLRVVGVEGGSVGRRAGSKGQAVAVRRCGIEHHERGLLDRLAPAAVEAQVAHRRLPVLPKDVFGIQTRREGRHGAVGRLPDPRDVAAQAARQAERRAAADRQGDLLLGEERKVVHERQQVVTVFAPRRGIAQVVVVEPAPEVSARRELRPGHRLAPHAAPVARPVGLGLERIAQRFGVGARERVPIARGAQDDPGRGVVVVVLRDVVTRLGGVDAGLRRGAAPVLVHLGEAVAVRYGALQGEVGDPPLVEQPGKLHGTPHGPVARPRIGLLELVGVGLGVVSAEVARRRKGQLQGAVLRIVKGSRVGDVQIVAVVGRIGRSDVGDRTGPLHIEVEDAPADHEALAQGDLLGLRLGRHLDDERGFALARADLHDAVRQVAVLDRRDAGDHLDRLDVRDAEVAQVGALGFGERRIVRKPHAVHLDGRAERGVAQFAAAARMQGDARAARGQVLVADRLAAGQQRGNVVDVEHLGMFDRAAVDDIR